MLDTSELKTTTRIMLNGFNYRRQLLGRVPFVSHRIRECHFASPLVAARNLRAITGRVTTMRPGDILIIVSLLEFSFYLMMYKGLGEMTNYFGRFIDGKGLIGEPVVSGR